MNKRQHKQAQKKTWQKARQEALQATIEGKSWRDEQPHTDLSQTVIPLEPRYMFDAAGLATGAEVAVDTTAQAQADKALADAAVDNTQLEDAVAPATQNENELLEALDTVTPATNTQEIIFVDSAVDDYQTLLAGIDSNIEVVMLDANRDGVEQIAEVLSNRSDLSAIHIISHGDAGQLNLGNTTLTAASMQGEHADELAIIGQALNSEADILIYGCNFAEGDFGQQAAESLAALTGADIAASDDLTGHASLGGDWDLEFISGDVGTVTVSSDIWLGLLTPVPLSFTGADYVDPGQDIYGATSDNNNDLSVGDQYLFANVDNNNLAGGAVDAVVTITAFSYFNTTTGVEVPGGQLPSLNAIDDGGADAALNPRLTAASIAGGASAGNTISATFTVEYFATGTATPLLVDSFVSPVDIDSSANLREAVSVTAPVVSVEQNNPTSLTSNLTYENGLTTIFLEQGSLNNGNPGVTPTPEFAATFEVQQAQVFTFTISSIIEGTNQTGERLFSVSFDETTFTTPNTLSVPILDLDIDDSSGATDLDYTTTNPYNVSDNGTGIPIVDISEFGPLDENITDSDSAATDMQSATITLTNAVTANEVLTISPADLATITGNGIVVGGNGTSAITFTGASSFANYQEAFAAITYSTSDTVLDGADRTIEFTINNGDIDSPVATATIDVLGTPTVNTLTTDSAQPTITGTWDEASATNTGLQVTVDGVDYVLGTDPELTSDGAGNWTLTLSGSAQTLTENGAPGGDYDVQASNITGGGVVIDTDGTVDELTVDFTAVADTYSASINNPLVVSLPGAGVLQNDTDNSVVTVSAVNGNALLVGNPATTTGGGSVTLNANGTFTYTPNTGFTGADTFTYTIADADGDLNTVTVTINVSDEVQAVNDTGTIDEDGTLNVAAPGVLGNDVDLNTIGALSVTAVTDPVTGGNGTLGVAFTLDSGAEVTLNANGSYDYNPNGQFENLASGESVTDTFQYSVTDGTDTVTALATITITGTDDAPSLTATADNPTFTEDGSAADVFDGVNIDTIEPGQTIEEIVFTVSDVTEGSDEVLVIDGVNIPLVPGGPIVTTGGYLVDVIVSGTDVTVTVTTTGAAPAAVQTLVDDLTYQNNSDTPNTGGTTSATRAIAIASITDSGTNAGSNENNSTPLITSTVTVDPVNDAPSTGDFTVTTPEGVARNFLLSDFSDVFSDPDNDSLDSIQITTLESVGALTYLGGDVAVGDIFTAAQIPDLLFTPAAGSGAPYDSFSYRAFDGTDFSGVSTTLINDSFTTDEGSFSYSDDVFGGTAPAETEGTYDATGGLAGGGLEVTAGGNNGGNPSSGAWEQTFNLTEDTMVDVTLSYRLVYDADFENGEDGEAVLAIDGVRYGNGADNGNGVNLVSFTDGNANDSGWVTETFQIALTAGNHTLQLGTFVSGSNGATELAQTFFDNVSVTAADSNVVTVDVTSVSAPTITNAGDTATFNESDPPVTIDGTLDLNNNGGAATIQSATVSITGGFVSAEDVLAFSAGGTGITGSYDAGTGILTLNGPANFSDFESVLESVTYDNTNDDNPTGGNREITWVVNDGTLISAGTTSTVNVVPVNDPPTITDAGATVIYNESDAPINIDTTLSVGDVDDTNIESATISITGGFVSSEDVLSFTAASGITGSYDSGTGVLTLSGSATLSQYEAVLESVTYDNTNDTNPTGGNRTITWVVNDGDDNSVGATSTVNVVPLNAPVNTVPLTTQTVDEDTVLNLTGISVNDADGDLATTQLSVNNGDLNVSLAGGATISAGANDSSTLTLSGTQAQINAALATLTYQGDLNFNGSDTLTVLSTDSSGIPKTDSDTVSITVDAVNDPPTVDLDGDDSSGTGAGGYDDTFTIGGSAVNITDSDVVLDDVEDPLSDIFLLNIDAGNILDGADEILNFDGTSIAMGGADAFFDNVSITGVGSVDITYTAATNLFEIRDSDGNALTLAEATTVLEAITYQNDAVTPDTSLARTFAVTLNDGTDTSNIATSSINVSVDINDEPIVTTLAGVNDTFTEGDANTSALFSNSDIDTIEAGQNIDQLVFTVSNVTQGASESLNLDGTSVTLTNGAVATGANYDISVSVTGATATVTLTASTLDTVTAGTADSVVEGVTYSNTNNPPTTLDRVVTLTTIVDSGSNVGANDNINDTVNVSSTITMVATTPDLDGDGEADATDLDDDNDGILDTDEDSAGSNPSFVDLSVGFTNSDGTYTVASDGPVTITITGGDGGDEDGTTGGQGATVTGTFNLLTGDRIVYIVGEAGSEDTGDDTAGGGGSTGVYIIDALTSTATLVMVAGAGGAGEGGGGEGQGGQAGTAGGDDSGNSDAGGTNGTGGTSNNDAGGGGGVGDPAGNANGDGEDGQANTGGEGLQDTTPGDGLVVAQGGTTDADGGDGFTAGGSGSSSEAGGGGGYSGGGAGGTDTNNDGGGGGGSFLIDNSYSAFVGGSITAGADGGGSEADGTLTILIPGPDTDGDGVNNSVDLDSDNDGISDLRESGATSTVYNYDTNNDGTISVAEGIAAGGTLTNGVWDFFGDDGATTPGDGTTLLDSDADTVDDFLDLDADNDGIADTIEARPTAGYVTNDGDVSDDDADGDGIINLFDNNDSTTLASVTSTQAGSYTVTASGQITITITGGDGGDDDGGNQGGSGATVGATFNVTAGDVIQYVVGESGTDDNAVGTTTGGPKTAADGGGGGGSTGVYINGELVLVAGGGGGGDNNGDGQGGQVLNVNTTGDGSAGTDTGAGAAGSNGTGGGGNTGDGGGGGGYDTAGGNGNADGGGASSAGLTVVGPETVDLIAGGEGNDATDGDGGAGFTSGGGADDNDAGGGGGYSGGGAAGNDGTAGGGGSFINTNPGVGYVSTVTATAGTTGGGTFSDGTLTIVNSAITPVFGGSFTTPEDTDGDGTADYLDTNSDDDSLLDIDESGLAPGAFDDANGDGIDDAASISASYADPDGAVNDPAGGANGLANQTGDLTEVGFREQVFPPVINDLDTDLLSYGVGSGPQKIDTSTAVTVTDADSVHFNTGVLTIDTPSNFPAAANEVLTVDGTTGNGITVGGSTISFNGDVIGTIGGAGSDGAAGDPLVITFTTNDATPAAVSALLETINYENTGTTTGASTVTFQVTDDNGDASNLATVAITVTDALAANPDSASTNEDAPVTVSVAGGVLTNDLLPQSTNTTYVLNYDAATEGALGAIGTWVSSPGTNNITLAGASVVTVNDANNPGLSQAISFTGGGTNATGGTFTSLDSSGDVAGNADVTFDFWLKLDDTTDADVIFETNDNFVGTAFVIRDSDMSGDGFDDLSFVITDNYAGGTFSVTADLSTELGAGLTTDYFHVVGTFDQNGGADTMELFINGNSVGTTAANVNDWDDGFIAASAGLGRANGTHVGTNLAAAPTYTDFEGDIASFSVYQSDFSQANVNDNLAAIAALTVTGVGDSGTPAGNLNTNFVLASGATVNMQADGSYVYDPNDVSTFADLNFGDPSVTDSFVYTVTDAAGTSTTQTVTITIEASNEFELSSLVGGGGAQGTIFYGIAAEDRAGHVLASGDINGDGFSDLIIGGPGVDTFTGETYVVFGAASGFAAEVELSDLAAGDGSTGFVLNGIELRDNSARSIDAGDFNGDGYDDIIISASRGDANNQSTSGETYIVYGHGGAFDAEFNLSDLATGDGTTGFVINGIDYRDTSGQSITFAGDVNGDGLEDIAIAAPWADPNGSYSGETYLIYGSTDFEPFLGVGLGADGNPVDSGEFELSALQASNGGDGSIGTIFEGGAAYDYSGRSVAGAGDINGDGFDDLVIGAWGASPGGRTYAGASYVIFGQSGAFTAEFDLSTDITNSGGNGFILNGITAGDYAGETVGSAGDFNGDGFDDIVIGATYADPNGTSSGETYLIYGRSDANFATLLGAGNEFELSSLAGGGGTDGVVFNGIRASDFSGHGSETAGDINGDGFDDLLIGRWSYDDVGTDSGENYVIFGTDDLTQFLGVNVGVDDGEFELSSLVPPTDNHATGILNTVVSGFVLSGIDDNDISGESVSSAGDVNGDGFDDIIVGAYHGAKNGINAGEAYIIYGKDFRNEGIVVGSSGTDSLSGSDTVSAGAGDDTITDPGTTTDSSTIDGGGGVDTLSLTADLNLTLLSNNVYQNIEIIDLTGGGFTLTIGQLDLFDLSGSTNTLTVNGTVADAVVLSGSWVFDSSSGGYEIYTNGEAIIRIQSAITNVTIVSLDAVEAEKAPEIDENDINNEVMEEERLLIAGTDSKQPVPRGLLPFSQQVESVNDVFNKEAQTLMVALFG